MRNIFVTVGTTKFPLLVDTITKLDVIKTLSELGCRNIQIQTGEDLDRVNVDPNIKNKVLQQKNQSWIVELTDFNIRIKYDPYFEDFKEQIEKADLIISHAGAGSCLEILRLKKPLVVVVNENLMDNHQTELANQLQKNHHLYFCICNTLSNTLRKDFNALIPYSNPSDNVFSTYLDKCCGFVQ